MCVKKYLLIWGSMEIATFLGTICMCVAMWLILNEVKKVERKIEDPDQKPKHERHWGNGRKR